MFSSEISPDDANRITIQSYNDHIAEYVAKDDHDDIRTLAYWPGIQNFLGRLQLGQQILEIGSGTGADAERIEAAGFTVQRTDIAEGFLQHMHSKGYAARSFDILSQVYDQKQSAILANAVFLHFNQEQYRAALRNVNRSLTDGGLFCMGMKLGDFEGWREKGLTGKRYFKFWKLEDLKTSLREMGMEVPYHYSTPSQDFAIVIARK